MGKKSQAKGKVRGKTRRVEMPSGEEQAGPGVFCGVRDELDKGGRGPSTKPLSVRLRGKATPADF